MEKKEEIKNWKIKNKRSKKEVYYPKKKKIKKRENL